MSEEAQVETSGIQVPVVLEQMDVLKAHFQILSRLPGPRLYFVAVGLAVLGAFLWGLRKAIRMGDASALASNQALVWFSLALLLALVLSPLLRMLLHARRHYLSMEETSRRGQYRFDEAGFHWTIGTRPGQRRWSDIESLRFSARGVFIREVSGASHWVPFRELDATTTETLRDQLQATLSERFSES